MRRINIYMLLTCLLAGLLSCTDNPSRISLAGEWSFSLDSTDFGSIQLPGTTDDAGAGIPNQLEPSIQKPQVLHLTRKNSYVGPAWYSKEVDIPSGWKGKTIELKLERVIWQTSVWVDGKPVDGMQESLIAPHLYDLTEYMTPGKHKITVRVDNRKRYDITAGDMAHAYTNETQIMWNGIIGEISLTAKDAISIRDLQAYPDYKNKQVKVKCLVNNTGAATSGSLKADIRTATDPVIQAQQHVTLQPGENRIELVCPIKDEVKVWNEFTPTLYTLRASIQTDPYKDTREVKFGFRDLEKKGPALLLNDRKIFLRGTLECCIFPLTGYPPMEHEGWEKVFSTAREWGLNHLRFHSWCPPKAAFEVADSLGFYLQVELPLWSTNLCNDKRAPYLYAEADRILEEYGNHPSFCLFSLGNELQYDFGFLGSLLNHVKEKDPRHLYTTTSFTFEKGHGDWPETNDDFFITQWTRKGWVRGQGVFNSEPPRFDKDYSASVEGMEVPLITHEIGQYAVYPDLKEIGKYTGVLDPLNFKGVKEDLRKKGLLDKADDYLMASGKLAALLYKEEIERAMKTPGISGFQLLDLHDFPGQGTALVGLLNAFWENKGVTEAAIFRQSCAPVTPLARFSKAVYTSGETFEAGIEVVNYSDKEIDNAVVGWKLADRDGKAVAEGEFATRPLPVGENSTTGSIRCPLDGITEAKELTLSATLKGTDYTNEWKIWVYPADLTVDKGDIIVTDRFAVAEKALQEGKKVLFNPPYESLKGLEGKFVPVFWSPVHFPKQAGTMGLLLDPAHPAFARFPTEGHTDWQWWRLATESKALCIDSLHAEVTPLVECVDNFANNRRLTNLFETNCLNGKLVVCSMDLLREQAGNPEKRQLLHSLVEYMKSDAFNPAPHTSPDAIGRFLTGGRSSSREKPESIY
ncbi:sugar-binding domain-containing protein [Parabacteroides sp.]